MKAHHSIVVLPGDGIGPEIVDATLEILDLVQAQAGSFALDYQFHQAGARCYEETGAAITPEALAAFERADATLKGPVGLPGVRQPDGTEAGLLGGVLRVDFDLYANVRPIRLLPNVTSALAGKQSGDIDYVIVRENTEGLYRSRGVGLKTRQAATDTLLLTAAGCERICRFAFRLARERARGAPADGATRVTLVDKSNVLRSFAFFRETFLRVAAEFADVETETLYVDAAAAALVTRPEQFQVIVTENLFGDILSDLGGATIGGLGMCPGANIGEQLAYFEPIHGSAPDIAGKGLANPTSQILAAAMMLRHLGENFAADRLEQAVNRVYGEGRVSLGAHGALTGGPPTMVRELSEMLRRG